MDLFIQSKGLKFRMYKIKLLKSTYLIYIFVMVTYLNLMVSALVLKKVVQPKEVQVRILILFDNCLLNVS